eukprot:13577450-Alexandrium_andersonii.AAC.1
MEKFAEVASGSDGKGFADMGGKGFADMGGEGKSQELASSRKDCCRPLGAERRSAWCAWGGANNNDVSQTLFSSSDR